MIVYPAMDLMGGQAVRLKQGRFEDKTAYDTDPAVALEAFSGAGAEWAHIVDLDGARAKAPVQHALIRTLARSTDLRLQVGGGFRTTGQIEGMLNAGVARVVIGSLAAEQPQLVSEWLEHFGADRITLSMDVRMIDGRPMVAVGGWTEGSDLTLWELADRFPRLRHVLITDIGRDGMLEGPNVSLLAEAVDRLPHLAIQASGGVSVIEDLQRLRTDGVIVGKALWEGKIRLEEALSVARP